MKKIKKMKSIVLMSVLLLALFLTACSGQIDGSAQEIIENVVKEDEQGISYYGESDTVSSDGFNFSMKEWRDGTGKSRNEVSDESGNYSYSVNDGSTIWTYDDVTKERNKT